MSDRAPAYEGWNTDSHRQTFDVWNRKAGWDFNFSYGCFTEQRYLRSQVLAMSNPRILDVGCATGTTYRYVSSLPGSPKFQYLGVDLSQPAIDRAKSLYPAGDFRKKGHENLLEFAGGTYDIVFSRDTVLHQTTPYQFLQELLDVAAKVLILRLRTRDNGDTVFDIERSCQMHYDQHWMPYIVLNIDELIAFLKTHPRTSSITLNRSYEVLGGQNFRYLPKELYFTSAGGAETALMITLSDAERGGDVEVVFEDALEGHAFLRKNRLRRHIYSVWSRVARRRSAV